MCLRGFYAAAVILTIPAAISTKNELTVPGFSFFVDHKKKKKKIKIPWETQIRLAQ